LLLIYKSTLLGQTILTSFPLDLQIPKENNPELNSGNVKTLNDILLVATSSSKNSNENNQILNVENVQTHDVFVFATDEKNITILKYNSALFLSDQYTCPRVNSDCKSLVGYSFSEDGNPILYWSSEGFKNILVIKYYLERKTYKSLNYDFPSSSQRMITQFQKGNLFYILSIEKSKQALIVYTFRNGMAEQKVFDFSTYKFQNNNSKFVTFNQLIGANPIEKIEADEYNPLFKSTKKSKVYMSKDHIILTLDHNSKKTQAFDLNIESNDLTEKNFIQSSIQEPRTISNSFYHDGKLYQINASESQLLLDIKDFNTSQTIKSVKVSKNDTIRFKNSPLVIQKDNRKPTELKKTKKFLEHLSLLDIGLSVYKNKQNTFITLGGTPKIEKINNSSHMNNLSSEENYMPIEHSVSVSFESILDRNFEFVHQEEKPFAIDNILYFLSINKKVKLKNILKFKDYYILGYYDNTTKQYVMRKFTDGFN
jgi:hypothetical protein